MLLFWGCDPETTPWGWDGQIVSRLCYWFTDLGIKQVYVCPDLNYGAAVHADKWIPIMTQYRCRFATGNRLYLDHRRAPTIRNM